MYFHETEVNIFYLLSFSIANGSNIRIENCPNFHFGNKITLITTNVINKEEQVSSSDKKGHDSTKVIPKNVKGKLLI